MEERHIAEELARQWSKGIRHIGGVLEVAAEENVDLGEVGRLLLMWGVPVKYVARAPQTVVVGIDEDDESSGEA